MWLAIKEAAGKPLPLKLLTDQLGSTKDAILYRRLVDDHPEVERGPDETLSDHFSRLQRSQDDWRAKDTTDVKRRQRDPRAKPRVDEVAKTPAWATLKDALPRHELLPGRDPGWFTSPSSESRGFGMPPLERRTPGDRMAPSHGPTYTPAVPSVDEWIKTLADKGIFLDSDGRRMTPEALPRRFPRGHDIWSDLIDRPTPVGRHRAAKVVVAFIREKLAAEEFNFEEFLAKQNRRHKMMADDGWTFRESGSGSGWEKKVGDNTHRIMHDNALNNDGEYDQGYTYYPPGGMPKFYTELNDAVYHAHTGQMQAEFSIKPSAIEDSSYQPERGEKTSPMNKLTPPKAKGKYQTLSSWTDV